MFARTFLPALLFALTAGAAPAAQPSIYRIERFTPGFILIHFDTEPFKRYTLQYTTNLCSTRITNITATATNVICSAQWSDLYTVPCQPMLDHFIHYTGSSTNRQRFYRLKVTGCN